MNCTDYRALRKISSKCEILASGDEALRDKTNSSVFATKIPLRPYPTRGKTLTDWRTEESRSCGSHRRRDRDRQEDNRHRRNANFELSRRARVHETEEEGGGTFGMFGAGKRNDSAFCPIWFQTSPLFEVFLLPFLLFRGRREWEASHISLNTSTFRE